jgi:hypothetical protein
MRLIPKLAGHVDRFDRGALLTTPFDLLLRATGGGRWSFVAFHVHQAGAVESKVYQAGAVAKRVVPT